MTLRKLLAKYKTKYAGKLVDGEFVDDTKKIDNIMEAWSLYQIGESFELIVSSKPIPEPRQAFASPIEEIWKMTETDFQRFYERNLPSKDGTSIFEIFDFEGDKDLLRKIAFATRLKE